MSALTAEGLTRRFGDLVAVNNLTFEVPDGVVVGFVGPNGSGKSTTIRVLLGLIEASGGTGTVLGEPIEHPERFADRVGALIESPALVGSLSGRDNLRSLAALRGLPGERIDEVLEIVGLIGREGDKASTYSLGMKQRLGIAAALLPDPEMLVLDEPTNGLDPAGIVEIRDLLRSRATGGRTVVVSSHLLSEIQAMADFLVLEPPQGTSRSAEVAPSRRYRLSSDTDSARSTLQRVPALPFRAPCDSAAAVASCRDGTAPVRPLP